MFDWVWLLRVMFLGFVGIGTTAAILSPVLVHNNTDKSQVAGVSSEKTKAIAKPVSPVPFPITGQQKQQTTQNVLSRPFNLQQSLTIYSSLFTAPTSLGMVAIGVAEGNYRLVFSNGTLYVQLTPHYFGHTDPGNLSWGDRVTNYGPCSDQGRSGGTLALAEKLCLERARSQLPTQLIDLNTAGIDPNGDLEAVLNAADLYNQAKSIHSRYFPKALALARQGGIKGDEALAWARTASFYLNLNNEMDLQTGSNQATGLLGICARENYPITEWECVYRDQMRRVKAISSVLEKYKRFSSK
ncbi:MAG TPA: hypothetical protein DDZ80_19735 [Cyanobacteria bacterium UBA8803]|nr:hypothetical protein [Cyanobacteria bacterium UBA9273]HBL60601.1 hypothetical protein [Cyanobacteria bacterium UBA8803]